MTHNQAPDNGTALNTGSGAQTASYRNIPSVTAILIDRELMAATSLAPSYVRMVVADELDCVRRDMTEGAILGADDIRNRLLTRFASIDRQRLAPIINATGVIIHTNLGRAPVSSESAAAMASAAASYTALEIEPDSNQRGGRMQEINELMRLLTGAEATLVVNNNASALLLTMSALVSGRSVVLSRGEAVEIGGGFRIPDLLRQSGATLVEVGTTNRTYATDYAEAIDEQTGAIAKIHPSNFRVLGFHHEAAIEDLAEIARFHEIPLIDDVGSGALLETTAYGLSAEPTIGHRLAQGSSIVTASGDKLLGGPQAGIIVGAAHYVNRIARHPLARAVRADKTCLAGLAQTLRHYLRGEAHECIPIWRMIVADQESLRQRAELIVSHLAAAWTNAEIVNTTAAVGGGSLPGDTLPSVGIALLNRAGITIDALARSLRVGSPAVFGHIEQKRLVFDLRTVLPEEDALLIKALQAVSVH